MRAKGSPTPKARKKSHWTARVVVILIGASMVGWGWLLVDHGVDGYPMVSRFGPAVAYSRGWIGMGSLLILAALLPWQRMLGRDQ